MEGARSIAQQRVASVPMLLTCPAPPSVVAKCVGDHGDGIASEAEAAALAAECTERPVAALPPAP